MDHVLLKRGGKDSNMIPPEAMKSREDLKRYLDAAEFGKMTKGFTVDHSELDLTKRVSGQVAALSHVLP